MAKKFLGNQDWTRYEQVVFPSVDAPAGTSACEAFKNAVFGTIDDVFAAVGRFEIKTFTGNVFTDILTFIRNIGALIGNAVLDGARIVLVNGVETALGPIVSAIATVATIAAVAGKIVDVLQPWTSSFVLDPVISRRDTTAHPGKVTLTMNGVTGKEDWPDQNAAPMIAKLTDTSTLDKNSTATMTFETLPESAEVAAGEEHTDGIAHVLVKVHRTDLDKLHELLAREALSLLPAVAQKIFGASPKGRLAHLKAGTCPLARPAVAAEHDALLVRASGARGGPTVRRAEPVPGAVQAPTGNEDHPGGNGRGLGLQRLLQRTVLGRSPRRSPPTSWPPTPDWGDARV